MTRHTAIDLRNKRYREGIAGTQCLNYKLLGMVDLQGVEGSDRHVRYGIDIGIHFASDSDFDVHGIGFIESVGRPVR